MEITRTPLIFTGERMENTRVRVIGTDGPVISMR
jgi:hypothetical protein